MKAVLFGLLPNGESFARVYEGTGCLAEARRHHNVAVKEFPDRLFAVSYDDEAYRDDFERREAERRASYFGPGYEAHPGYDHEDCCK